MTILTSVLNGEEALTPTDIGLGAVDNTADLAKPISTATQAALDLKADITAVALKADAADVSNVDNTSDLNKPISNAEFEATRANNRSRLAGSGDASSVIDLATGYDIPATVANQFTIKACVKYIDGIRFDLAAEVITLPAAPNGLQRSAGGADFATLADAITAGGTGLTASVITRQDLIVYKVDVTDYSISTVIHQGLRDYIDIADAMAAFSYTQDTTDKGLWTDGTDLFIYIALPQSINFGLYHPTHNPEGAKKASDNLFWYNTAQSFTSTSDCFDTAKLLTASGTIASGVSGRPSNSPYLYADAKYAGQVHDKRTSSNRKTPAELKSEYSKKGIAGDIRGSERVPFTRVFTTNGTAAVDQGGRTLIRFAEPSPFTQYGNQLTDVNDYYLSSNVGTYKVDTISSDGVPFVYILGNHASEFAINTQYCMYSLVEKTSQYQTLPWADLLASDISLIASIFPNGVQAQWVPDTDGTSHAVALNRKCMESSVAREYSADGITWVSTPLTVNNTTNETAATTMAGVVQLVHYSTASSPYELANNAEVIGEVGDVVVTSAPDSMLLGLIGKVGVSTAATTTMEGYTLDGYSIVNGLLSTDANYQPEHDTLTIANGTSPTIKASSIITQENSQYFLQWVYKEMIFDVSWGDNNKFDIVDGESTVTDDNGNSVIVGQQRVALPFFTGKA